MLAALLSNVMSLPPKFDEVREAITDANYDLAFLTETWLRDHQSSNAFAMSGYNFFRRDRSKDLHGGVCIYIKDSIKYEVIDDLFDERLEAIWIKIRPPRLPRGMSSIVISTIYHPQTDKGVSDTEMLNYLYESMTVIESRYSNCGFIVTGDFNRLNTQGFRNAFKLKQIVHFPTRGTRTLDCIFTNLSEYYTAVGLGKYYGLQLPSQSDQPR